MLRLEYVQVSVSSVSLCCSCTVSSDLYGLFLFLGVDPYWVKLWWNKLLFEPFKSGVKQPLYSAVAQVLWRTAKDDVIDQVSSCHLSVIMMQTGPAPMVLLVASRYMLPGYGDQ